MKKQFLHDSHIDDFIEVVKQDNAILNELNIEELEYLSEYLNNYEEFLTEKKGD